MSLVALCRALPQLALATCCCCRPTTRRDGVGKESSDMQSTADYGGTGSPGAARQDCPKSIRCGSNTQKNTPWRVEARVPLVPSSTRPQQVGRLHRSRRRKAPRHLRRFFILGMQHRWDFDNKLVLCCMLWLLFFYQRMHTCCVYPRRLFERRTQ